MKNILSEQLKERKLSLDKHLISIAGILEKDIDYTKLIGDSYFIKMKTMDKEITMNEFISLLKSI